MGDIEKTRRTAGALVIVVATAVCYANAVSPAFQFDDYPSIVQNQRLSHPAVFLDPVSAYRSGGVDALARFVAYASFGLDRQLWGLDARGFHLTNVIIHVLAALLVYVLAVELFRTPRLSASVLARSSTAIALGAALLFAVHPVQTQAVSYIVQRMTSLATGLGLAGLVAWLRFRRARGRGRLGWMALGTLATATAMLTKEIAFTFPVLAVILEALFFEGPTLRRAKGLLPALATMAIVPAIVLAGAPPAERLAAGGATTLANMGLSRVDYLLTQARVLLSYLRLLVLPTRQNLFPDYPISHALTPEVAAAVAFHALALGGAAWAGWRWRRDRPERALIAFGVIWFYVAVSVESLAVVIVDVYNEHRLYFPSVGPFLAVSVALATLAPRLGAGAWRRRAVGAAVAVVILSLGAATVARNRLWSDEVAMWEDVARKGPRLAVARRMVGVALARRGRAGEAVEELRRAVEMDPYVVDTWIDLASAYRESGREPLSAHAWASERYLRFDFKGALALWEGALARAPAEAALHHGRALALRALGRGGEADEEMAVACGLGSARACAGGMRMPDP